MSQTFTTVFAIYDNMTHLDFTGPHQVLCRLPNASTMIASRDGGEVTAEGNLVIGRTIKLSDIEHCDLLCVPGGVTATQVALDEAFISEVRRLGLGARYVTSVCTGSLILGAAGLRESAQLVTGPGGNCCPSLARSWMKLGSFATGILLQAVVSPQGSILR